MNQVVNAVEAEITAATEMAINPKENRKTFLKRLNKAVNSKADADESFWETLTEAAQEWVNDGNEATANSRDIPDFKGSEGAAEAARAAFAADAGDDLTPSKNTKGSVKVKKAPAVKLDKKASAKKPTPTNPNQLDIEDAVAAAPEKPGKKASGKKAVVKKVTKATKTSTGIVPTRTLSPAWRSIMLAMSKHDSVSIADMKKLCDAKKVGLYYRRFEAGGLLVRAGRGMYSVTAEGKKALAKNGA